jgi:hypothetical protein
VITVIKYLNDMSEPQTMALDFMHNTKYAQPLMDRKMREARNLSSHGDTNNMNKRACKRCYAPLDLQSCRMIKRTWESIMRGGEII